MNMKRLLFLGFIATAYAWRNCNGTSVDIKSDVDHCGKCNTTCPTPANGQATCILGSCGVSCSTGYTNCNNTCLDVQSDPNNCGACGAACPVPTNGQPSCIAGQCGFASCNPGFADCNNDPSDGCEIDLQSDPNNCGTCANKCAISQCVAGTCPAPGCYELNTANTEGDALVTFECNTANYFTFDEASCQTFCTAYTYYNSTYYSLTYNIADLTPSCCLCYDYNYRFYALQPTDPPCIIENSTNYGQYTSTGEEFTGPGSEYVYII